MGAVQGCLSRGSGDTSRNPPPPAPSGLFGTLDYGQPIVIAGTEGSRSSEKKGGSSVVNGGAVLVSVSLQSKVNGEATTVQREGSEQEVDFGSGTATFAEYTDLAQPNMAVPQVKIQKPAPFFKGTAVVDGVFKDISLEDYKGKYVVLFFYPADFTFVCPTEIIAFSDRAEDFRKIGCEVIGASTDSHFSHFAWVNTPRNAGGLGKMDIPLLADKTGEIARKYGIYKDDEGIAFRGLFIIDGKQNLRQITVNDLPVGRSVEETLRLVQAFQFTDANGEVCPANWKPGKKTMKPTMEDSKSFFKNEEKTAAK